MAEGGAVGAETVGEPTVEDMGRVVYAAAAEQIAPTLRQWELGMRLRSLRAERRLSVQEVAERLLCPSSKIQQMEAAARLPTETDLRDLRALFQLDDSAADQLAELVREAELQGWWADYQDLRVPYIGLEQHASSITSYTMQYFPALLQADEYARAIITTIAPQTEPKILEERVEARMRRQQVLNNSPVLHYTVLLDEVALHRPTGGRTVMRKQLDKALKMIRSRKVDVRVVPFEHGAGVAQDSNFVLLQFNERDLPPIVYIEGLAVYQLFEGEREAGRYLKEIERLGKAALDPSDSVEMIDKVRSNYQDD